MSVNKVGYCGKAFEPPTGNLFFFHSSLRWPAFTYRPWFTHFSFPYSLTWRESSCPRAQRLDSKCRLVGWGSSTTVKWLHKKNFIFIFISKCEKRIYINAKRWLKWNHFNDKLHLYITTPITSSNWDKCVLLLLAVAKVSIIIAMW